MTAEFCKWKWPRLLIAMLIMQKQPIFSSYLHPFTPSFLFSPPPPFNLISLSAPTPFHILLLLVLPPPSIILDECGKWRLKQVSIKSIRIQVTVPRTATQWDSRSHEDGRAPSPPNTHADLEAICCKHYSVFIHISIRNVCHVCGWLQSVTLGTENWLSCRIWVCVCVCVCASSCQRWREQKRYTTGMACLSVWTCMHVCLCVETERAHLRGTSSSSYRVLQSEDFC